MIWQNKELKTVGERITDLDYVLDEKDTYEGQFILVRRGKKRWFLVNLER